MNYKTGNIVFLVLLMLMAGALQGQSTDSLTIKYSLINSFPQDAAVYINDVYSGDTPYYWMPEQAADKKFTVKLKGYIDYSFNVNALDMPFKKDVMLIPKSGTKISLSRTEENKAHFFGSQRRFVPLTLSALTMVASGISAYMFKSKAIDKNDEFNLYGDPAALDKKKQYDLISGISIVVFQAGLAAFVYFLLEKY